MRKAIAMPRRRIPKDVPYHGPKERPRGPYVAFILLEFWLVVAGLALLFVSPLWGGVVLGVAVLLFILGAVFGS